MDKNKLRQCVSFFKDWKIFEEEKLKKEKEFKNRAKILKKSFSNDDIEFMTKIDR